MILVGSVVGETDRGINIFVPFPERIDKLYDCHSTVGVEFVDKRRISAKQRRKTYVLISYIAAWWGYTPVEAMKEMLKLMFVGEAETFRRTFSLSDCDMTTARLFITYLIDFCLLHGVDVGEPLYMNKRCAVCGRKAELHHVDAVGMGRNRKEICHIGMRALPLCREHHTEIHSIGQEAFLRRYFLEPVKIDERIADVYRLKAR